MQTETYGRKITVHRCDQCGGLFCKPDVLLEMKREWMSEIVLDSGNKKLGQKHDALGDINCPECGIRMDQTFDQAQKHIWFETCSQCEGMYFDAGEFSDLKYETLMDRVRDIVKGARPKL
jgi:ribosomal protein S27E